MIASRTYFQQIHPWTGAADNRSSSGPTTARSPLGGSSHESEGDGKECLSSGRDPCCHPCALVYKLLVARLGDSEWRESWQIKQIHMHMQKNQGKMIRTMCSSYSSSCISHYMALWSPTVLIHTTPCTQLPWLIFASIGGGGGCSLPQKSLGPETGMALCGHKFTTTPCDVDEGSTSKWGRASTIVVERVVTSSSNTTATVTLAAAVSFLLPVMALGVFFSFLVFCIGEWTVWWVQVWTHNAHI